jgi:hypothetical protein
MALASFNVILCHPFETRASTRYCKSTAVAVANMLTTAASTTLGAVAQKSHPFPFGAEETTSDDKPLCASSEPPPFRERDCAFDAHSLQVTKKSLPAGICAACPDSYSYCSAFASLASCRSEKLWRPRPSSLAQLPRSSSAAASVDHAAQASCPPH